MRCWLPHGCPTCQLRSGTSSELTRWRIRILLQRLPAPVRLYLWIPCSGWSAARDKVDWLLAYTDLACEYNVCRACSMSSNPKHLLPVQLQRRQPGQQRQGHPIAASVRIVVSGLRSAQSSHERKFEEILQSEGLSEEARARLSSELQCVQRRRKNSEDANSCSVH